MFFLKKKKKKMNSKNLTTHFLLPPAGSATLQVSLYQIHLYCFFSRLFFFHLEFSPYLLLLLPCPLPKAWFLMKQSEEIWFDQLKVCGNVLLRRAALAFRCQNTPCPSTLPTFWQWFSLPLIHPRNYFILGFLTSLLKLGEHSIYCEYFFLKGLFTCSWTV